MFNRKSIYQLINKYHRTIGLFVAMHFLIFSLTGLLLLFKSEVQQAHPPLKNTLNQNEFAVKYNKAYQFLLTNYRNDKPLDIYPNETNPTLIQARLGKNGSNKVSGAKVINIDYETGVEVQAEKIPYSDFYNWLLTLHHQLFLGTQGQIYIGIVAIAFILMNVTGLVMFLRKRNHRPTTLTRLAKYSKLHQYLGFTCLFWGLLVGITGALLAFNPLFTKSFQNTILQQLANKYKVEQQVQSEDASLKAVINTAFAAKPQGVIWYIIFPGMERGIQNYYLILVHGRGLLNQYINEYLVINAKTAELKEIVSLPTLMQLALVSTPLHTANYGGIVLKIIWSTFAISTLCFAFLGVSIFFTKRRLLYVYKK